MANSASVRTGLHALIQDHLSDKAKSTLFNTMPFLGFLFNKPGNKTGVDGIGIPKAQGGGAMVSRLPLAKPEMVKVLNSDKYMPAIVSAGPAEADGKVMTQRDTMPTRSSWTTTSPVTYIQRPFVKWVERVDPIFVPKKDISRVKKSAPNEKLASVAVGDLFKFETDMVLATHLQWWNKRLWDTSTSPSNVDADVWDAIYSIPNALKEDNNYCGVDRSLAANSYFRGNYVTAQQPAVFEDLINDALYTRGIAKKGIGVNLCVTGLNLFRTAKAEARAKGHTLFHSGAELPQFGKWGFKGEVVQFDNTFIIMDPQCPSTTNGDTYDAVAMLNLDTWTVAIQPEKNFAADEPFDLSKTEGGKDAIKSQLRTELMLICEVPSMNVWYNRVGA